jgi:CheY-like chemotaxis protein
MTVYRILIVDDQREVARVFRSGLESLEAEFEITDLLSGEEALLELSHGQIDLLISDVRLPGITGLELMEKFKIRLPDIKVVLISGVTDPKIRKQVAQAGADAFFFKPIEMADFLDAIERTLGLVDTVLPNELEIEKEKLNDESKSLSEHITNLRQDLSATAAFLLSDTGQTVVSAGNLPKAAKDANLLNNLLPLFSTGTRISRLLGSKTPDNLLHFKHPAYDLYFSQVGEVYGLLVITEHISETGAEQLGKLADAIRESVQNMLVAMRKMGVSLHAPEAIAETDLKTTPEIEEEQAIDPELEDLFEDPDTVTFKKEEVEAFWSSLEDQKVNEQMFSGDALSYEQAQQLGLTPKEEDD